MSSDYLADVDLKALNRAADLLASCDWGSTPEGTVYWALVYSALRAIAGEASGYTKYIVIEVADARGAIPIKFSDDDADDILNARRQFSLVDWRDAPQGAAFWAVLYNALHGTIT
jgi:hypothetical protein